VLLQRNVFVVRCYAGNLHGCDIAMHINPRVNATFIGERMYGRLIRLSRRRSSRSAVYGCSEVHSRPSSVISPYSGSSLCS